MEQFIVYQSVVDTTNSDTNVNISVDTIVRKVFANSKEEAIGKFIECTKHLCFERRLNIYCINLNELSEIH